MRAELIHAALRGGGVCLSRASPRILGRARDERLFLAVGRVESIATGRIHLARVLAVRCVLLKVVVRVVN